MNNYSRSRPYPQDYDYEDYSNERRNYESGARMNRRNEYGQDEDSYRQAGRSGMRRNRGNYNPYASGDRYDHDDYNRSENGGRGSRDRYYGGGGGQGGRSTGGDYGAPNYGGYEEDYGRNYGRSRDYPSGGLWRPGDRYGQNSDRDNYEMDEHDRSYTGNRGSYANRGFNQRGRREFGGGYERDYDDQNRSNRGRYSDEY